MVIYKKYGTWEPVDIGHDEIDFKDEYDKTDPIDNVNLDESITELNKSIREQEDLLDMFGGAEWTSKNEDERRELEQQIAFNKKKQELYIMRASKTILSCTGSSPTWHGSPHIYMQKSVFLPLWDNYELYSRKSLHIATFSAIEYENLVRISKFFV